MKAEIALKDIYRQKIDKIQTGINIR